LRGGESAPDSEYLASIGLSPSLLELADCDGGQIGRSPVNQLLA